LFTVRIRLSEIGRLGLFMGTIEDINRVYTYQVSVSLEVDLKGVLDWLYDHTDWDMYVDLKAGSIRYCFKHLADASAFNRRFDRREAG
jgi:hypothetical protein